MTNAKLPATSRAQAAQRRHLHPEASPANDVPMTRQKLAGNERKALILESARVVFSRQGYAAARTQEIARHAGVSEALMYRHFPSKEALYRAVLRQIIREQNENYQIIDLTEYSARGLVLRLHDYFRIIAEPGHERMKGGFRLLLASIAGDGSYASLIYRRAQRKAVSATLAAMQAAQEDGDLPARTLSPANISMFIEHVGTMLSSISSIPQVDRLYQGSMEQIANEAFRFCCRGLGLTDEVIDRCLASRPETGNSAQS